MLKLKTAEPDYRLDVIDTLSAIDPESWNGLAGDDPFLRHEFLSALAETGCACERTGWTPQFVALRRGGELVGALPLYLKSHSYGEYVFDWAWADAYARHGLAYYPKLVCAVPFTPVTGRRLLAPTEYERTLLARAVLALARDAHTSSLHFLFPDERQAQELASDGLMLREGVQFQWRNLGYASFDDFLASLTNDKRKKIRQERRKVREAGVSFVRLGGRELSEAQWAFFARCYASTYRRHFSKPYLKLDFFRRIGASMPDNILLVLALRHGKPIAAALDLHNRHTLYGRYWGALEQLPALHFETCYYQAIEFCIERGIATMEGGAQGEHKLARGFLPERTWSAHWLAHPQFSRAVEDFLTRESRSVTRYLDELSEHSPYHRNRE
jgi:predicted N-acyltransferase